MPCYLGECCRMLVSLVLPPCGVLCERGCGKDFVINICLTLFGFIPGVIHACCIICCKACADPEPQAVQIQIVNQGTQPTSPMMPPMMPQMQGQGIAMENPNYNQYI